MDYTKKIFPVFFILSFLFSCNDSGEAGNTITATINNQDWEFYEASVERETDGLEIQAQGYLEGDRGAVPSNLVITLVGVPEIDQIETPYTAYFAPNTQENAAIATIQPTERTEVFQTELDSNAGGTFVITEVDGNTMSGEFSFIATDEAGRSVEVQEGRFNNLQF